MVCGFYFFLDIFRYFLFFFLQGYLSYNFLCKWKKQLSVFKKNGGYFMPVPPARPGDCQGQEPGVLCFIFEAQNLLCASCMSGE